jgi:hypothetical protein
MLSPGKYHSEVPRSFQENLAFRWRKWRTLGASKQREMKAICKSDLLFFVNTFVWQYNPKCVSGIDQNPYSPWAGHEEVEPFITFSLQEATFTYGDRERHDCYGILRAVERQVDHISEKSREEGVSWQHLIVLDWLWLFHPMKALGVISRDEDAVDKLDDPDALFWKLDFIHDHLPPWLMPKGWEKRKHRKGMFFKNPENGSTISGEASTAKAFVGGRKMAIFIDEMSQIDKARDVLARTADVASCRLMCGTHTGVDTMFYEVATDRRTAKTVMHWSDNPWKSKGLYEYDRQANRIIQHDKGYEYPPDFQFVYEWKPNGGPRPGLRSPWYDAECVRRQGIQGAVARDLDINPKGATSQFFDPATIRELVRRYCCEPVWEGELHYDRETGRPDKSNPLVKKKGGRIRMWVNPLGSGTIKPGRYGAGCDLSYGTGATPSCLSIFNADTGDKVLEVKDASSDGAPNEFAPFVTALCWLFKTIDNEGARLGWENEGPGSTFGKKVLELGYSNVYWRHDEFKRTGQVRSHAGWQPTAANRRLLLSTYARCLASHQVVNYSEDALLSTLDFKITEKTIEHGRRKVKGQDPSGAGENHGDVVISDALAVKMVKEMGIREKEEEKKEVPVMSLAWRRQQYEAGLKKQNDWA